MHTITVTVKGAPGSGKSTISQIIKDSLDLAGIKSQVEDEDGSLPISAHTMAIRVGALKPRIKVRILQQQE